MSANVNDFLLMAKGRKWCVVKDGKRVSMITADKKLAEELLALAKQGLLK